METERDGMQLTSEDVNGAIRQAQEFAEQLQAMAGFSAALTTSVKASQAEIDMLRKRVVRLAREALHLEEILWLRRVEMGRAQKGG